MLQTGKYMNYTDRQGHYLTRSISVQGTLYANRIGKSGYSDELEEEAPSSLYKQKIVTISPYIFLSTILFLLRPSVVIIFHTLLGDKH